MSTYTIPQKQVAKRLGLSARDLRAKRGPEGRWWEMRLGCVFFSHRGIFELQQHLAGVAKSEAAPVIVPDLEGWYTVKRVMNHKALHVVKLPEVYDPRRPTVVWLPRPLGWMFVPGMKIRATPRNGVDGLLDYSGGERGGRRVRFPRARGKW